MCSLYSPTSSTILIPRTTCSLRKGGVKRWLKRKTQLTPRPGGEIKEEEEEQKWGGAQQTNKQLSSRNWSQKYERQ